MPCHRLLWALILLALPVVVVAGNTAGATGLLRPGSVADAEVPKPAFKPKLDLRLGARHLPLVQDIRPVPSIAPPDAGQTSAERPLTFALDVRTRQRVGDEVRAEVAAPPSLGDEIESAFDRSTFGVTGTYRF